MSAYLPCSIISLRFCRLPRSFVTGTTAATISPLSLHDALPISRTPRVEDPRGLGGERYARAVPRLHPTVAGRVQRSEEHTSELQSLRHLVCRLLLEKKKNINSHFSSSARRVGCLGARIRRDRCE